MSKTAATPLSSATMRCRDVAADLGCLFQTALKAHETRRALDDIIDDMPKNAGLVRCKIGFVTGALASRTALRVALALLTAAGALLTAPATGFAQNAQIKRGQYLVTISGCNDCHTPGYFFGKPDKARFLGGSEVGFEIPGVGVFHGPNLTPDRETGLGTWSPQEIVTAITKGQRPDGRTLSPIMPWHAFANLTGQDARAIAAFLKSVPAVKNKVPGPFGPNEKPTSFVMKIVPPETATAGTAK